MRDLFPPSAKQKSSHGRSSMSTTQSIRFRYWNCQGLSLSKLAYINACISNLTTDIFVISEHWFAANQDMVLSPFFLASSPRPRNQRTVGHENGGIALFAHPQLRHLITLSTTKEFAIQFALERHHLSAVYLPPRLTPGEVQSVLNSLAPIPDTLLGDVNVRYGKDSRDNRRWNPARGDTLSSWTSTKGLNHILCHTGCSRNDHVFSVHPLHWEYLPLSDIHLSSDHDVMAIEFPIRQPSQHGKPTRFALSLLKEQCIQKQVLDHWEVFGEPVMRPMLYSCLHKTRPIAQEIIDRVYSIFEDILRTLCESIFPTYCVQAIKATPDTTANDALSNKGLSSAAATRIFKRSQRLNAARNPIRSRDPSQTALSEAYEHYNSIYSRRDPDFDTDPSPPAFAPSLRDLINDSDTLRKQVLRYPVHKSGGPDGIDTRLLHCLIRSNSFLVTLKDLFNVFFRSGSTPLSWNQSLLHLLIKDPQQPFADKTRPVALTCILRRIFEKLLLKDWEKESWTELHPSQAGFRRGFSTQSHILLSDAMSRQGFRISVFLDLKAAFDRVPHSRLLSILQQRGCPDHARRMIFALMMNKCSSLLTVNQQQHEDKIHRRHGVFQGSILSPFLFNIFIDNLAHSLNFGLTPCQALLYADDINIKAKNWQEAQRLVTICEKWALRHGMIWGISKCGVVGCQRPLLLNCETLPRLDSYPYLGLPHGSAGIQWERFLDQTTKKTQQLLNSLMIRRRTWSMKTRLTIYKTFIRSTGEYCLPLLYTWYSQQLSTTKRTMHQKLQETHRLSLEFVLGVWKPAQLAQSMTALGSWETRATILSSSLANSLEHIHRDNPLSVYLGFSRLFNDRNSILHKCQTNPLTTAFNTWRASSPAGRSSWKTFCRYYTTIQTHSAPGVLQHFIRPRARINGLLDSCLTLEPEQRDAAIRWRCNTLFTRRLCPDCQAPFNRAHLHRCDIIPAKFRNRMDDARFIKDTSHIRQELDKKSHGNGQFTYTVLDYLLNNREYRQFSQLVDYLEAAMIQSWRETPGNPSTHPHTAADQ